MADGPPMCLHMAILTRREGLHCHSLNFLWNYGRSGYDMVQTWVQSSFYFCQKLTCPLSLSTDSCTVPVIRLIRLPESVLPFYRSGSGPASAPLVQMRRLNCLPGGCTLGCVLDTLATIGVSTETAVVVNTKLIALSDSICLIFPTQPAKGHSVSARHRVARQS